MHLLYIIFCKHSFTVVLQLAQDLLNYFYLLSMVENKELDKHKFYEKCYHSCTQLELNGARPLVGSKVVFVLEA